METKTCPKCTKNKSILDFNKNISRKDGLQNYCRECQKINDKNFQPKRNSFVQQKRNNEKRQKNRQYIIDYLKLNPCIDCFEKDVIVLEFDHRGDKKMDVSTMVTRGYSLKKIKEEIEKCDVRCANCHRRKTAKQFKWYKELIV